MASTAPCRDRAMVGDRHGIVWFLFNASKSPTATYWIWAPTRPGGKADWCLYDARSDGPWPTTADDTDNAPIQPGTTLRAPVWEALTPEESRAVRQAITQSRITFRAFETLKRGSTLRIRLKPWADAKGRGAAVLAHAARSDVCTENGAALSTLRRKRRGEFR